MADDLDYIATVDAAAQAISQRITGLPRHVIRQAAAYAVATALPLIEAAARADERAKVAEETETEWACFLAHRNSAGRGYAYVSGHDSRESAQDMADYLATPERPAWVGQRLVHPFRHDHPDPENAAAIARRHAQPAQIDAAARKPGGGSATKDDTRDDRQEP